MFFINGGINDSAVVWVDGTFANNDSILVNLGKLIIKRDFINNAQAGGDGTFPLQLSGNDGLFEVYGDWENNGIYYAGEGKVKFYSNDVEGDSIQGTSITTFHDVDVMGPVRRVQDQIDAHLDATGTLKLNVGEWATDFNLLLVTNPSTGAIQRDNNCYDCGYVSSLGNPISGAAGSLGRIVNQTSVYRFPTGSSLTAPTEPTTHRRYRPVTIQPITADLDTFRVRMVNRLATVDNLPIDNVDTTICYLNPWWYHKINKNNGGVVSADVSIYANFNEPSPFFSDEDYNTIANWNATTNMWENMGNSASGYFPPLDQVVRYQWNDYQPYPEDAYILGFNVPQPPLADGDTALCASVETTYTVPNNGSTYDFVVNGGTVTNQTNNSISIIWDNDSLSAVIGTIQIIETVPNGINGGCSSHPATVNVEIWPLPVADFGITVDTTLPGGIFIHDIIGFVDSSINTAEWYWDFGDGNTSSLQNPFHSYYETGTYDVTLVVRSGLECLDTLIVPIDVVEGLIVPNVFTPNNDGWNDVFDIRSSDVGNFKLEVYNRWGNVVYENASPLISWDGTTMAGVPAPAGTYFFVISKAEMNSGNAIDNEQPNFSFKETGWVQLLR